MDTRPVPEHERLFEKYGTELNEHERRLSPVARSQWIGSGNIYLWDWIRCNKWIKEPEPVVRFLKETDYVFLNAWPKDAIGWKSWTKRIRNAVKSIPSETDMTAFQVLTLMIRRLREAMKDRPEHLTLIETVFHRLTAKDP